jgi:hypothetical protein
LGTHIVPCGTPSFYFQYLGINFYGLPPSTWSEPNERKEKLCPLREQSFIPGALDKNLIQLVENSLEWENINLNISEIP